MRICRSVTMLLLMAGLAMAQDANKTGVDPMAGNGSINNNIYTNSYFGFTYKFPTTWKVLRGPSTIAETGGCASTECRLLALQAQSGIGRMDIRALPLSSGTSARDVFQKVATQEEAMGLKPVGTVTESESGGWKFYRADYRSETSSGEILESVIATEAKGNVLVITVLTSSKNTLNDLATGLQPGQVSAAQGQAAR